MKINKLQDNWQRLASQDPFWAVLSHKDKQGNKWNPEAFFATGRTEVQSVMEHLKSLSAEPRLNTALDFGCGLGRLSQAMAKYFNQAVGVDIAPAMVQQAVVLNRQENCSFVLNATADLKIFPDKSFSFIYSRLTFQHMEPKYTKSYLKEFVRVLEPGGVMVFVQPYKRKLPKFVGHNLSIKEFTSTLIPVKLQNFIRRFLGSAIGRPVMELYSVSKKTMASWLKSENLQLVAIDEFGDLGPAWVCLRYCIQKDK